VAFLTYVYFNKQALCAAQIKSLRNFFISLNLSDRATAQTAMRKTKTRQSHMSHWIVLALCVCLLTVVGWNSLGPNKPILNFQMRTAGK